MNNFSRIVKNKVLSALNEYSMLQDTDTVIVGFSGGADSVCLLHILYTIKDELNINVEAAHLNHGIRGEEAKRDELFALSFCEKHSIPFFNRSVDCLEESEKSKESLEECARRLRYDYFKCLTECRTEIRIATAHNANDNAETLIFNLSRGCSVNGAGGIPPVRENIIRPLLFCSRNEIEGYCRENNLDYVTDSTNLSDDYTRNRIRHNILPVLNDVNSGAISNISDFCRDARIIEDFIGLEACKAISCSILNEATYDVTSLLCLHDAVLNKVIALLIKNYTNKAPQRSKIELVRKLLFNSGRAQLYGNSRVEVINNVLRFYENCEAFLPEKAGLNIGERKLFGKYAITTSFFFENLKNVNKYLLDNLIDYDRIEGNLFLRCREDGDKFTLPRRNVTKTLKNLFNEFKIPIEERKFLPILCDDKGIVWIYSVGVCDRCKVNEKSDSIILINGEKND